MWYECVGAARVGGIGDGDDVGVGAGVGVRNVGVGRCFSFQDSLFFFLFRHALDAD